MDEPLFFGPNHGHNVIAALVTDCNKARPHSALG